MCVVFVKKLTSILCSKCDQISVIRSPNHASSELQRNVVSTSFLALRISLSKFFFIIDLKLVLHEKI